MAVQRITRECEQCGQRYEPRYNVVTGQRAQRYCSEECRKLFWRLVYNHVAETRRQLTKRNGQPMPASRS